MKILEILKTKNNILTLGISLTIMFLAQLWLLKNLPGEYNYQCLPGAYFTKLNIFWAFIISFLVGMNISGIKTLYKINKTKNLLAGSSSSLGILGAFLTSFCIPCFLPVITILGFSISINIVTEYIIWFKIISIFLLLYGLKQVNSQLNNECEICQ